jgi:hypothetical protein
MQVVIMKVGAYALLSWCVLCTGLLLDDIDVRKSLLSDSCHGSTALVGGTGALCDFVSCGSDGWR